MLNTNPFINIQLSIVGNVITVQYDIDPLFNGRAPYTFELLAFEDESFKTTLYCIPSTTFFVIDNTNIRQNQLPGFFYKLRLTDLNKKCYYSNFFGWHPSDSVTQHHYLLASEITRREQVRFNYAGLYVYLLKRKNYATDCIAETDPITGEPMLDTVKTFGTGVVGGYYEPVLTRISIENREVKEDYDAAGRGTQFSEMLLIRSAGFPYIDQHDIIVMRDGKRFIVIDPANKYFPGTTMILLQSPTLRLIPSTDTTQSIQVPPFPVL
jgi:hypothetical protein